MLAPLLFVSGVASCLASGIMGLKEDNDREVQYAADQAAGYNSIEQDRYDLNLGRIYYAFNLEKIIADIQKDYPKMNHYAAQKVALASVAKKLMEEETRYKYRPSESTKYFDLDKYAKEEYRAG